jgi:hypothetical protein
MADREWHWEQGTTYAVEAMKALLAINGGAAVALLAFAGQIGKNGGDPASIASRLGNSLVCFGFGALAATIGFVAAYFTQLYYGKGGVNDTWAHQWHCATYAWLFLSIAAFLFGLWLARAAILVSFTQSAS